MRPDGELSTASLINFYDSYGLSKMRHLLTAITRMAENGKLGRVDDVPSSLECLGALEEAGKIIGDTYHQRKKMLAAVPHIEAEFTEALVEFASNLVMGKNHLDDPQVFRNTGIVSR